MKHSTPWLATLCVTGLACGGAQSKDQNQIDWGDAYAEPLVDTGPERPSPHKIHGRGIGPFHIEQTIPAGWLHPDSKPELHYQIGLYADAQPLEGFAFDEPPVFVVFDGPFSKWALSPAFVEWIEEGKDPLDQPERFSEEAVRQARAGAPIRMLVLESTTVGLENGLGLGSTYDALQFHYNNIRAYMFPPLWEDPTCVARSRDIPTVHFFFEDPVCTPEPTGEVTRVVLYNPYGSTDTQVEP